MKKRRLFALLLCLLTLLCCTVSAYAENDDIPDAAEEDTVKIQDVLIEKQTTSSLFERIFESTTSSWLSGILNSAIEVLDTLVFENMRMPFRIEVIFDMNPGGNVISKSSLENLYSFMYRIAVALATIKFLFKGFQIYVLWRNGDADASPRDMLVGAIAAEVIMIGFPFLYVKAVDIAEWIATTILSNLGGADIPGANLTNAVTYVFGRILTIIIMLIWVIMAFILWIRVMKQGFELLILRVGLPLATLSLIDSDMALFKNYMQVFLKTFLTLIIQIALMSVSMRLIVTGQADYTYILVGIAIMGGAMQTPKLLQQFLVPQSGGSGLIQKTSSVAMLARSVKALVA